MKSSYSEISNAETAAAIGHVTALLRCVHDEEEQFFDEEEQFFFELISEIEDTETLITMMSWLVYGRLKVTQEFYGLSIGDQIAWLGDYGSQVELGTAEEGPENI